MAGDSQGATWTPDANESISWARTYARAIAGRPLNMSFDHGSGAFALCFETSNKIDTSVAPTEIFASTFYRYPNGAAVSTTPNLVATPTVLTKGDPTYAGVITVRPAAPSAPDSVGCVWIRPH